MFCTKCGVSLGDDARFCSQCGNRTHVGPAQPVKTLLLDKRNKKVAGVCAGFARYLEVDVIVVRVVWLAVALATGVGFIAYLAAWMIMPSDRGLEPNVAGAPCPQPN